MRQYINEKQLNNLCAWLFGLQHEMISQIRGQLISNTQSLEFITKQVVEDKLRNLRHAGIIECFVEHEDENVYYPTDHFIIDPFGSNTRLICYVNSSEYFKDLFLAYEDLINALTTTLVSHINAGNGYFYPEAQSSISYTRYQSFSLDHQHPTLTFFHQPQPPCLVIVG